MFSDQKVLDRLEELNVLLVKADKTIKQKEINADLARFGRNTIPTNILAPSDPSRPAIILPEYLTPEVALEVLDQVEALSKENGGDE